MENNRGESPLMPNLSGTAPKSVEEDTSDLEERSPSRVKFEEDRNGVSVRDTQGSKEEQVQGDFRAFFDAFSFRGNLRIGCTNF
jgi:hypothetical protein